MTRIDSMRSAASSGVRTHVRRFDGPLADELWIRAATPPGIAAASEAFALYREVETVLEREGASFAHLVQEVAHMREVVRDGPALLASRKLFLPEEPGAGGAITLVGEAPLGGSAIELLLHLVVPHGTALDAAAPMPPSPPCCPGCPPSSARSYVLGGTRHLFLSGILGRGGTGALDEAARMFEQADERLALAGMTFANVVRTWIYLRHMERDYGELNRARRRFFAERQVELRPASTGIEGAPPADDHDLMLSLLAIGPRPGARPMSTGSLNEAWEYGADFSRGMRVDGPNATTLFLSGTASVDEEGRTVHAEELERQVERTIVNVEGLLGAQGAGLADLVSATTYLKRPSDAPRLRELLAKRRLLGLPHILVEAEVCRPDLLVEMEAVAQIPARRCPAGRTA